MLSVPDTQDRYYVFSIMNMWTDVFGSAGKRTTGTGPGNFLIAGPKWQGTAPTDMRHVFKSPTRYAWALGQTQANGPDDFAAVNAIQAEYKLTPLSSWGSSYTPPATVPVDSSVDTKTIPPDQVEAMDAGTFFNRLAMLMKENPPYSGDFEALWKLKKIEVEPGKEFDIGKIDLAVARGLNRAVKDVLGLMQDGMTKMKTVNGWNSPARRHRALRDRLQHQSRYCLRRFGRRYSRRHHLSDRVRGRRRDPLRRCQQIRHALRAGPTAAPPTAPGPCRSTRATSTCGTQSIATLSLPGCRSIQFRRIARHLPSGRIPGQGQGANWLPVPKGSFNVTIRNYWPKETALDGTYKNPPDKKMSSSA